MSFVTCSTTLQFPHHRVQKCRAHKLNVRWCLEHCWGHSLWRFAVVLRTIRFVLFAVRIAGNDVIQLHWTPNSIHQIFQSSISATTMTKINWLQISAAPSEHATLNNERDRFNFMVTAQRNGATVVFSNYINSRVHILSDYIEQALCRGNSQNIPFTFQW